LFFGKFKKIKENRERMLERLRAGRFYQVTCEKGHTPTLSALDLWKRMDNVGERMLCPECYESVMITEIKDGTLMTEEQKKKQQEDYLVWSEERKRELRRRQEARGIQEAALGF
jgi:hypothetical protein